MMIINTDNALLTYAWFRENARKKFISIGKLSIIGTQFNDPRAEISSKFHLIDVIETFDN